MKDEYFTSETAMKLEDEILRRLRDNLWAAIGSENAVDYVVKSMNLNDDQSDRLAGLLRVLVKSSISLGIEIESPGFVEKFSGKPIDKKIGINL